MSERETELWLCRDASGGLLLWDRFIQADYSQGYEDWIPAQGHMMRIPSNHFPELLPGQKRRVRLELEAE